MIFSFFSQAQARQSELILMQSSADELGSQCASVFDDVIDHVDDADADDADLASQLQFDLGRVPCCYVWYGVKYTDLL